MKGLETGWRWEVRENTADFGDFVGLHLVGLSAGERGEAGGQKAGAVGWVRREWEGVKEVSTRGIDVWGDEMDTERAESRGKGVKLRGRLLPSFGLQAEGAMGEGRMESGDKGRGMEPLRACDGVWR